MEGMMTVQYRSSTRTERSAEVTLDEVTIGALLAALEAMVREGMPQDAEVTLRLSREHDPILAAFSAVETPATKELI
jgi:hypothetical protein